MKSLTMIRYVVTAALRDRLIIGLCFLLIMAVSLSIFMGSAALTEQDPFVAVFAAGSIRMLNVFGLVLFIVFFIRRSFETRDIEFMLSRPIGRIQLVLSFAAGFSILAKRSLLSSMLTNCSGDTNQFRYCHEHALQEQLFNFRSGIAASKRLPLVNVSITKSER